MNEASTANDHLEEQFLDWRENLSRPPREMRRTDLGLLVSLLLLVALLLAGMLYCLR